MSNKVKPITPDEAVVAKVTSIPDEVFEAFNEMIASNFDGHSSVVLQKDVKALAIAKLGDRLFKTQWLDIEPIYRKAGWTVEYDKPAYNESYDAKFTFRKTRKT